MRLTMILPTRVAAQKGRSGVVIAAAFGFTVFAATRVLAVHDRAILPNAAATEGTSHSETGFDGQALDDSAAVAATVDRFRQVNSSGAELMVLSRTPQGWRITAIDWSSRTRRPPGG